MSSFFIFLLGCATTFEKVENKVSSIDKEYGTSVEDYSLGLKYFDIYARNPALNQPELEKVIGKLQDLKLSETNKQSIDLLQFRINLFEAEKLYKTASRKPRTSFDGVIRCSKSKEIQESVNELRDAVKNFEDAANIYETNEWNFMPSNWLERVKESDSVLLTRALTQENGMTNLCPA